MVEWNSLIFNGLWVLGAAVIVAAFSLSVYETRCRGGHLRVQLGSPGIRLSLMVGFVLVSLGIALIGPRWWERVLWGLLCALSVWQLWTDWQEWKAKRDRAQPPNS
jgi:hypothetical protein